MPEIDIIHVYEWTGERLVGNIGRPSYTAEKPDGEIVWSETEEFGVDELAELGAYYGVTRWAERGDTLPDLSREVILVGWADAPIGRDDVATHSDGFGPGHPAVNVKVYNTDLPKGEDFAELVAEHELDPRLAALSLDELREMVDRFIEKDYEIFNIVCADLFEHLKDEAEGDIFEGRNAEVWSEGRSGGWAVVHNLPDDIAGWDAKLLTQWHEFTQLAEAQVADVPRAMAWHVLANRQDELAGRVVNVSLRFVLGDDDLEILGDDPTEWDWEGMLDLSTDSTITVTKEK